MSLTDEIHLNYQILPRKDERPTKVSKILEERLRRHRYARELRLSALERA